jgi:hypothetical protein
MACIQAATSWSSNSGRITRDQVLAVPDQYGDVATTPLEATVDADHTHFEFTVEK